MLYARLHVALGKPLDEERLDKDIQQIYALGFLDKATYEVVQDNGQHGPARDREAGRTRHDVHRNRRRLHRRQRFVGDRPAACVSEDRRRRSRQRIPRHDPARAEPGLPDRVVQTDRRRAEVDRRAALFAERRSLTEFNDQGDKLGQIDIEQYGAAFSMGREFWRHAALFGGIRRYAGSTHVRVGEPIVVGRCRSTAANGSSTARGIASTTATFHRTEPMRTSSIRGRAATSAPIRISNSSRARCSPPRRGDCTP